MADSATLAPFSTEEKEIGERVIRKMGEHWRATGRVPKELFFAFCESAITVPIEIACFRNGGKGVEVLLVYRKDEYYDGYHIPGAVLMPGRTVDQGLDLLIERELGPEVRLPSIRFLFVHCTMKGGGSGENVRGQEIKLVHGAWWNGEVKDGKWFSVNDLPPNIIPEHQTVLPRAMLAFLA